MSSLVSYDHNHGVAVIGMDDGKVNAMSIDMMMEVDAALDQAQTDGAVVVLTGRRGIFSAGFELSVFEQGYEPTVRMLRMGAALNERIFTFPTPVIAACSGHAIAMGSFLLMVSDYRIAADGEFKIGMNEVAIGLTLPYFAIEIARHRLAPSYFDRATILAELYAPQQAVVAGFLDRVVEGDALIDAAREAATTLSKLDMKAHFATKLRTRRSALDALRQMVDAELNA